jgi:hypothetical protein
MNAGMIITVYLSSALVCGLIAAIAAPARGRHSGYWMIAAFLVPPTILLLFMLGPGKGDYRNRSDPFRDADDHDRL